MKAGAKGDNKEAFKDAEYFKLLFVLVPLGLLLLILYWSGERDEKQMRDHGVDTECVMVACSEGRTGARGPKEGYVNQFEYYIGSIKQYCYVFTSIKPLPIGLKLNVRYVKTKEGKVRIDFPDVYKEQYKAYGFNDYGY